MARRVEAVIFTTWADEAGGGKVPNAIDDVLAWAVANNERLPIGEPGEGAYLQCGDVTGQIAPDALAGVVYAARLDITAATALQFAADSRFWQLGYRTFDSGGNVIFTNWSDALDALSRTAALNWLEANGYSRAAVAARFGTGNTRKEILDVLRAIFCE